MARRRPFVARGVDQGAERVEQVLGDEGEPGAAVVYEVAQFGVAVHGVDRHDDRVGAQDAVVGEHPLRAVLHHQQHAVAGHHAAIVLQVAGDAFGLVVELREAQLAVVEDDEGFVGEARRRHLGVVEQMRARQGQVPGQAGRPVPVGIGAMGGQCVMFGHRVRFRGGRARDRIMPARARMAKLADAADLKSAALSSGHTGSIPVPGTNAALPGCPHGFVCIEFAQPRRAPSARCSAGRCTTSPTPATRPSC